MADIIQIVGDGARGGGTTYVLGLTEELISRGFDVAVLTDAGTFLEHQAREMGAQAVGLPFGARRNTPAVSLFLRRNFACLQPKVVHVHGSRAGLPTALISRSRNWRLIYSVHGLHFVQKRQPARLLGGWAEAACMKAADEVVFVCQHDQEEARRRGVLGQGVQSRVVPNAAEVEVPCEPMGSRTYDIGLIGRVVPPKNPLMFCEVLSAMRPARPSAIVVGDGVLMDRLKARAEELGVRDQITFAGELPRTEALRAMAQCRTLILPSVHEGQPLTVIEAAHLGVPVVASALAGVREVVDEGETGFLVDPLDPSGYADCLGRLIAHAELALHMSRKAQEKAAREFSFQRVVAANLSLYGLSEPGSASAFRPGGNGA